MEIVTNTIQMQLQFLPLLLEFFSNTQCMTTIFLIMSILHWLRYFESLKLLHGKLNYHCTFFEFPGVFNLENRRCLFKITETFIYFTSVSTFVLEIFILEKYPNETTHQITSLTCHFTLLVNQFIKKLLYQLMQHLTRGHALLNQVLLP